MKIYVGQSKDLANRIRQYTSSSYLNSKNGNSLIRSSLLKYGIENFEVGILDYCPIELLDEKEDFFIQLLDPDLNILREGRKGLIQTPESRAKVRETLKNFYKGIIKEKPARNIHSITSPKAVHVYDEAAPYALLIACKA